MATNPKCAYFIISVNRNSKPSRCRDVQTQTKRIIHLNFECDAFDVDQIAGNAFVGGDGNFSVRLKMRAFFRLDRHQHRNVFECFMFYRHFRLFLRCRKSACMFVLWGCRCCNAPVPECIFTILFFSWYFLGFFPVLSIFVCIVLVLSVAATKNITIVNHQSKCIFI